MNAKFGRNVGIYPYMRGNGVTAITPEMIAGTVALGIVALGTAYVVTRKRRRRKRK